MAKALADNGLTATPASYYTALESSAIDMGAAGFDADSGFGLIQAPGAINAVLPLAVTRAGFSAEGADGHVRLQWETISEQDNAGFNLWRGTSAAAPEQQLNDGLIPSQGPDSSEGFAYEWLDAEVEVGTTYYYWLETVGTDGSTSRFGPVSASVQVPTSVTLGALRANPSSASLKELVALALMALAGVWLRRR